MGRVRRLAAFPPAAGRAGKEEASDAGGFSTSRAAPATIAGRQRHEAVLAALAAAHMQARMTRVRVAQIAQFDADGFAHAQAGVIDQAEDRAVTREFARPGAAWRPVRGVSTSGRVWGGAMRSSSNTVQPGDVRQSRKKARRAHLASFMAEPPNFLSWRRYR